MDIANGKVLTDCKAKYRHQKFLSFMRQIDKEVPGDFDVHIILEDYASHKHPKVKGWLAEHERFQMHFIPTYSSWLNQAERWFGLITDRAIRRGVFASVKDLVSKIKIFVNNWNENAKPFVWTATADSILEEISRLCDRITGTQHYSRKKRNHRFPIGRLFSPRHYGTYLRPRPGVAETAR